MGTVLAIWAIVSLLGVPIALVFAWVYLKNRLADINSQIARLTERLNEQERDSYRVAAAAVRAIPETPVRSPHEPPAAKETPDDAAPVSLPVQPPSFLSISAKAAPAFSASISHRSTEEWETLLGSNWLNKVGVFVLVVGIALALGYSFTRVGPWGRVSICVAVSSAMLLSGVILEKRERYRTFARGLLGGGWAGLYVTVFAMHAVESARVIQNPVAGFLLLLGVAAGIIVHSLRYRSEAVTGLAYLAAFGALVITEANALSLLALVPLAISLLSVAHHFRWPRMAILGVIATYGIGALRGDAGAALWAAQSILAVYWLLFELFDIVSPSFWLLPLNATGFIGLSLLKWGGEAPQQVWILLAAIAAAYLASAIARWRSGSWHSAITLSGALAAAAIFQRLDSRWIAAALVVEAELLYLGGIRLRAPYLRWLGTSIFGLGLGQLLLHDVEILPAEAWAPVASLEAVVFYVNRALYAADYFYGLAGAGLLALVLGKETSEPYRTEAWLLLAAATFAWGWWRRPADFRIQGYLIGILGLTAALAQAHEAPLALAAALCYGAALIALRAPQRFVEGEARLVRRSAAVATAVAASVLLWRLVPDSYVGLSWLALALLLLESGLRGWPHDFRRLSYVVATLAIFRLWIVNLPELHNAGPWSPRLVSLAAALLVYAFAIRARREEAGRVFLIAFPAGSALLLAAAWALVPAAAVAPVWATIALVLASLQSGSDAERTLFRIVGSLIAALAFVRCWSFNLGQPGFGAPAALACLVIACFYAVALQSRRDGRFKLYYSLLGTTLTTILLYYKISGSILTVAWGIEGVALLGSGLPLRDRTLRISGLTLLVACILKLFLWDFRHLETFPRILSFIVLGLILVGVSWIYTRFRERVEKYL
jgi:hypothetical protein